MPRFKLLVTDLDNTLYDWVGYFVPAFYSMAEEAAQILGCDLDLLLNEMRDVHRKHHDAEHPFALLETQIAAERLPGLNRRQMAEVLDSAFHRFNSVRLDELRLYEGVMEGLSLLAKQGVQIVAHTESKLFGALDRLARLDVIDHFSNIYCRERPTSLHPDADAAERWLSKFALDKVTELSHHQRKPSADVLLEICAQQGVSPSEAAYLGDSIPRDVMMAKNAGVFAIWAKYGTEVSSELYEKLVRVSHWTPEDVERERNLKIQSASVHPDLVAASFLDAAYAVTRA